MLRIKKTNIYKSKSKKISSNQLIFILIFNQKIWGIPPQIIKNLSNLINLTSGLKSRI
jgi:hypothetical protein